MGKDEEEECKKRMNIRKECKNENARIESQ